MKMEKRRINFLLGYGILIFIAGIILGLYWIKYFQFLIPVGSLLTFIGVFLYFKNTNLKAEFAKNPKDDMLTYFWDVIILKLWIAIFIIWMIFGTLFLLIHGLLDTRFNV